MNSNLLHQWGVFSSTTNLSQLDKADQWNMKLAFFAGAMATVFVIANQCGGSRELDKLSSEITDFIETANQHRA